MTTTIETVRSAIEEVEEIEIAILSRLQRNPKIYAPESRHDSVLLRNTKKRSYKETLTQQHEVSLLLSQHAKRCGVIKELLQDTRSSMLAVEIATFKDSSNDLKMFDSCIANIKLHHERYPNLQVEDLAHLYSMGSSGIILSNETDEAGLRALKKRKPKMSILSAFGSSIDLDALFTGEELLGKYVDLSECHKLYLNLPGLTKVSYLEYLDSFNVFSASNFPKDQQYKSYLGTLAAYLRGFYDKAYPLEDVGEILSTIEKEFETQATTATASLQEHEDGSVWCDSCNKLFAKRSVYDGHLSGKRHKKAAAALASPSMEDKSGAQEVRKLEFEIVRFSQLLEPVIISTKQNTTRRRALTDRERALEIMTLTETLEDDESDIDVSDKDEVENPNNMPLGIDGKPMPFWLYKLQGLSKGFTCEICCNETYRGRRGFASHFFEPRHIHGLKCLGIEPSGAFKGITAVDEAVKLWDTLKKEKRKEEAEREGAVEVEDQDGNVIEERVYEDLKRQGLL
ncbi:hypothetical protein BABINDRAFT_163817 [Babjeviella inositovora NRRL Y-12698]|uniref:C2H2-type domain-containing protein n=1 Tax=Babjeviella inositovora NRRL Y-12698 TaxID=984486 RepID=A0A1E3QJ40_9ASCO|nr:uncharacterized protein BABINDRAFT_163817 [Babjeviella inositovora NRRL Y-12698]ODQ77082.1 hypothetical protein BABINDRAFT_163817 [Babjeviella inositovora NRRL Y-12698]